MSRFWASCALAVGLALATLWLAHGRARSSPDAAHEAATWAGDDVTQRLVAPGPLRWMVVGGGATPAQTQASMEADAREVGATLGGAGQVYFAAGHRRRVVQTLGSATPSAASPPAALRRTLAELFAPRAAEATRFTEVDLPGAQPARLPLVRAALDRQLQLAGAPPLVVWVGTHGDRASHANAVTVALWGGDTWTPSALAALHDAAGRGRPLRLVMTSCFSGGFGELVFAGASAKRGASGRDRCGLFAAPWDLESSGCDPDPDRRRHRGYARVFLAALRRSTVGGAALPMAEVDFDGDGSVSLLDAHTRVRIASQSYDVPTTTSERWLRAAFPAKAAELPVAATVLRAFAASADNAPEEWAVLRAMGQRLRLRNPLAERLAAWRRQDGLVADAEAAQQVAQAAEDQAYRALSSAILARWPALDDPWHPEFARVLTTRPRAVLQALRTDPGWAPWRRAREANAAAGRLLDQALLARAWAERLLRAGDTLVLAARLQQRGGAAWQRWLTLRTCERHVPPLRATAD